MEVTAPEAPSGRHAGAGAEAAWFALATAVFIAVEITVLQGWIVLSRPLWLDEIHTLLVAQTQPFAESVRVLAAGADFNPPTVFLLYRLVDELTGGLSAPAMRVVASVCVIGGLTAAYILLRDQFSRAVAAVGVLAVWAQTVVVQAAFEARFYGPLLFATGWLLVALRRAVRGEKSSRWTALWLAVASIVVCTVHYFGILSWVAGVAMALAHSGRARGVIRRMLPGLAGPLVTLACIPLFLGQRDALSVGTWIPAISVGGVFLLLAIALLPPPTIVALLSWAGAALVRRRAAAWASAEHSRQLRLGPLLLLAQAAVPVALAVFSLAVQPATQPRYWIVGAFAAAPIIAFVIAHAGRPFSTVVAAASLAWSVTTLRAERASAEAHARRVEEDEAVVAAVESGIPIVVRNRHTLYPLVQRNPSLHSRLALFDASAMKPDDAFMAVERDVARVHRRLFGFPNIVTPADLDSIPAFYFIELNSPRAPSEGEFPNHGVTQIAPRAYSLDRR